MAKRKMNAADEFFYWASTAPLNEVEEQYKRMGSVVSTRRKATGKRPATKRVVATGVMEETSEVRRGSL